jgi:protocatechuate 4,5-dioxygenase alpha chain
LTQQLDFSNPIKDTLVFDLRRSHQGYRINKLCNSLIDKGNRDAFKADESAYMDRFHLNDEEKQRIRERDWSRLVDLGGNIYFLIKLGFVTQNGLYRMGAQMRGETLEKFLATRNASGAR